VLLGKGVTLWCNFTRRLVIRVVFRWLLLLVLLLMLVERCRFPEHRTSSGELGVR
jgi:hypothetical protein